MGSAHETDLVLRNKNTGQFEVYNIAQDRITGAAILGTVGLDWTVDAITSNPAAQGGAISDPTKNQLTQAMAGFGASNGAAESLNPAPSVPRRRSRHW